MSKPNKNDKETQNATSENEQSDSESEQLEKRGRRK
jgi:hypothetical protein